MTPTPNMGSAASIEEKKPIPNTSSVTRDENGMSKPAPLHAHAVLDEDDAVGLAAIGKAQAFDRRFNIWSVIGFGVCASATWEGISSSILGALTEGGGPTLLWGYVIAALGSVCVACSLAEMASIWPSSGAQYHWAAELSSGKWRPIISWMTGWFSFTTLVFGTMGTAFAVAIQIQSYAIVSNPETYTPERWHAALIYFLIIFIGVFWNIFCIKWYHNITITGIILHVVFFFVTMITLLATTYPKNDASFVFTTLLNQSGWKSDGTSFCIGLAIVAVGFVGIEAPAHFAEELRHAPRDLPRAIVYTVATNAVFTFPWIIVLLFCCGDLASVLASPIGTLSPMTQIYINSTGKKAVGIFLNMSTSIIAVFGVFTLIGASARTMYAMARDKAFPEVFARIHPRWDVPVWPTLLVGLFQIAVGCIYIGNQTAFFSLLSGIILLQMASYTLPILLMLYQRRIPNPIVFGPWRLGKSGVLVNAASLLWVVFLWVFLCFPLYRPVTAVGMNYAVAILGGMSVIGLVIYVLYARSRFIGPLKETGVDANVTVGLSV